ncbi:MAG: hypothetical protein IJ802_04045, partial [Kiritimatiellae bacterium]|nr:hypothetical protein [Kiritimatiellia bacterium]
MKKSLARVAAVMAVASIVGCAGGTAKKTIVYNDITVTIKAETERAAEVRAEAIARTARRLSDEIARRIDAVSAGGKFTDLPDLTDAEIQKTAGMQLPAEELAQLKEIAKKELAKAKKEKLY